MTKPKPEDFIEDLLAEIRFFVNKEPYDLLDEGRQGFAIQLLDIFKEAGYAD